jgi:hypothetical protein
MVAHRQDRIDAPDPCGVSAGESLHPDRADFEFAVVLCLEDHAVIVRGLRMLNFAEGERGRPA